MMAESKFEYASDYPRERNHFDREVGRLKVKTLNDWIKKSGINPAGKRICEVGFGGGYTLKDLMRTGEHVFGIEIIKENIEHAVLLGCQRSHVFDAANLPTQLPEKIELWIFEDSFEHIEDPANFVAWMERNSAASCAILVVAPQAGSLSERVLGKLWPHRIPDHFFHWSKRGIVEFMSKHGFRVAKEFFPAKYVSLSMLVRHVLIKFGRRGVFVLPRPINFNFKFNLGEMGIVFEKYQR